MDFLRRREAAGKLTEWQRGLLKRLENFTRREREKVIAELQAQIDRLLKEGGIKKRVRRNDGNQNEDQRRKTHNPN